jgi:hypothetical protein
MYQKTIRFLKKILSLSSTDEQPISNLPRENIVAPNVSTPATSRNHSQVEWLTNSNNASRDFQTPDLDDSGKQLVRLSRLLGNRGGASKAYEFYHGVRNNHPDITLRELIQVNRD